jgi:hypothetical protein
MKMLVGANPQHLVTLLLPGAKYEDKLVTELQNRTIEADLLLVVTWHSKKTILHVEFQRRRDRNMGKRLWEYNMLTTYLTNLPVCSFAIYLKKDGKVVESPYERKRPDGKVVHTFHFDNIKLWEIPADAFKQPDLDGLLPLLPLTRNGMRPEMVEEMIESLDAAGKQDLLPLGYAFAALVFNKEDQRDWLRKRFDMLRDILEESWAYQEMVQKGLQQGIEQGLEQGRREGELRALRQAIVDVVQERFPDIAASVKRRVQTIEDPSLLRLVNVKMSTLPTAKEAQQYVRSIGKDRKDSYKSR